MKPPKTQRVRYLTGLTLFCIALFPATSAKTAKPGQRRIELDVAQATKPLDRFFDLSVGSDFPGTLIRDDSQLQLKKAVDELGFRYIRFHAIFHDVLGICPDSGKGPTRRLISSSTRATAPHRTSSGAATNAGLRYADGPSPPERYLDLRRFWSDVTISVLEDLEKVRQRNVANLPAVSNLWDTAGRRGFDYLRSYKKYVSFGAEGFYPSNPLDVSLGAPLVKGDLRSPTWFNEFTTGGGGYYDGPRETLIKLSAFHSWSS